MKKLVATLVIGLCACMAIHAQNGSVKVSQSAEIDALVNGKKAKEQTKQDKKAEKEKKKEAASQQTNVRIKMPENTPAPPRPTLPDLKPVPRPEIGVSNGPRMVTKTVHKRVKVMGPDGKPIMRKVLKRVAYKGMRKTAGFRVQVFSGGNTRVDRQKAEQAGHKVKAQFPEAPVYVHFYSPRWICRVGNYTDQKDAAVMLRKIKELGFPSAVIVRSPVTVRNAHYVN